MLTQIGNRWGSARDSLVLLCGEHAGKSVVVRITVATSSRKAKGGMKSAQGIR